MVASLCVCVCAEFILAIFLTQLNFADQSNLTSNFQKYVYYIIPFWKVTKILLKVGCRYLR